MQAVVVKKQKAEASTVVKKMKDYSQEPAFKKKAAKAAVFLKKNGLPKFKKAK